MMTKNIWDGIRVKYTCSICGRKAQTSPMMGVPDGMYALGCRAVGDAFYCEDCVRSWSERNGEDFDSQHKDVPQMFITWWNKKVDELAKEENKKVSVYHRTPWGDYAEGSTSDS